MCVRVQTLALQFALGLFQFPWQEVRCQTNTNGVGHCEDRVWLCEDRAGLCEDRVGLCEDRCGFERIGWGFMSKLTMAGFPANMGLAAIICSRAAGLFMSDCMVCWTNGFCIICIIISGLCSSCSVWPCNIPCIAPGLFCRPCMAVCNTHTHTHTHTIAESATAHAESANPP